MTIRLLSTYRQFKPNTNVTLASGTETALVAGGNATTDLSGGVPYDYQLPANTMRGNVAYATDGVPLGIADSTGKIIGPFAGIAAPGAPTGLALTAIAGGVLATMTAPASTGGTAITGYEVTLSTGQVQLGETTTITVNAPAGVAVTATAKAINGFDKSVASSASASATPTAFVTPARPGAPTSLTLTAGNSKVTATWTAAASNGSAIRDTIVTLSNGATGVALGTATTVDVATLNGLAVTATARANNGEGAGPVSGVSNSVTPGAAASAGYQVSSNAPRTALASQTVGANNVFRTRMHLGTTVKATTSHQFAFPGHYNNTSVGNSPERVGSGVISILGFKIGYGPSTDPRASDTVYSPYGTFTATTSQGTFNGTQNISFDPAASTSEAMGVVNDPLTFSIPAGSNWWIDMTYSAPVGAVIPQPFISRAGVNGAVVSIEASLAYASTILAGVPGDKAAMATTEYGTAGYGPCAVISLGADWGFLGAGNSIQAGRNAQVWTQGDDGIDYFCQAMGDATNGRRFMLNIAVPTTSASDYVINGRATTALKFGIIQKMVNPRPFYGTICNHGINDTWNTFASFRAGMISWIDALTTVEFPGTKYYQVEIMQQSTGTNDGWTTDTGQTQNSKCVLGGLIDQINADVLANGYDGRVAGYIRTRQYVAHPNNASKWASGGLRGQVAVQYNSGDPAVTVNFQPTLGDALILGYDLGVPLDQGANKIINKITNNGNGTWTCRLASAFTIASHTVPILVGTNVTCPLSNDGTHLVWGTGNLLKPGVYAVKAGFPTIG